MAAASLSHEIRRTVIDESMRAGVGHIGSSLSVSQTSMMRRVAQT